MVTTLGLGSAWLAPGLVRPARACGGTFCDAGPTAMPVEQTGETILFVVDPTHVEAHIQIAYDPETEASQFAWVVPVTALPEFSVGSQLLFDSLLSASVPSYGRSTWNEPCDLGDEGDGDGCDEGGDGAADTGGVGEKLDIGGGSSDPEVVLAATVGAFEVFVLDGGTADGVMTWLGDNGFQQDAAALPILEEYLAEGHLFVAFRLANEAEVSEIHPIVLRYEGSEPCVPIRLTRIAAKDDMEIRALFLGDYRFASSNYAHVTLNPLKIDWLAFGANYRDVVAMAIDAPGAEGHAFVTEYAGPSAIVPSAGFVEPQWDPEAFRLVESPGDAIEIILDQGLVGSVPPLGECGGTHPLVEGLLARYLPVPPELPFELLCEDPLSYANQVDPLAWDGNGFADDLVARIIEPGLHAEELLTTWPTLTRLYTMLSPNEMTQDPMFHATPELPEQPDLTIRGVRNQFCDGHTNLGLPDGRLVTTPGGVWPDIAPDSMPWAETIAFLPAAGAPVIEVDNRETIDALLDEWNAMVGPPRLPTSPASPACDGSGGVDSVSGTTAGADEPGSSGCGCRSRGPAAPGGMALLGLALLGLRRRRGGPGVSSRSS
ncbi:MAG: DUF2330 domain-containing protein [Myxococcales bacterium]|nr:DUF2330 domain-containing protein [Myxococcales bacterium]